MLMFHVNIFLKFKILKLLYMKTEIKGILVMVMVGTVTSTKG